MGILDDIRERIRSAALGFLFEGSRPMTTIMSPAEKDEQSFIALARDYYAGDHKVYMTDRQEAWLKMHGDDVEFTVNHCATVIDAVVERLEVTGFEVLSDISEQGAQDLQADETKEKTPAEILWDWWSRERMDAVQIDTHRYAIRDGEAFVLIDWDVDDNRPEFILHQRYVDEFLGGDSSGIWMEYPFGDDRAKPERAVKQWYSYLGEEEVKTEFRTIYYEDRIEKYVRVGGRWEPLFLDFEDEFDEEGQPIPIWPIPWTYPDGTPLGIPVAHFKNSNIKSEIRDVIPLQDALNKTWLDILAASDSTAFRIMIILGWTPTTDGKPPQSDGGNLLHVLPGQMLVSEKHPDSVRVDTVEPSTLAPLLDTEDRIVFRIASVSDTPLSRFVVTRQIAAESTLKQQEAPLIAKVEERQILFGNAWEDVMMMAVALSEAFGTGYSFPEDSTYRANWRDPATRDDLQEIQVAQGKKDLGVDIETLLGEIGYDADQIMKIMESPEFQARIAMMEMARLAPTEREEEEERGGAEE